MTRLSTFLLMLLTSGVTHAGGSHTEEFSFNAADAHFDHKTMARARAELKHSHGSMSHFLVLSDRLEYRSGNDEDSLDWDLQGWYGGDLNKLWIKSEGEYSTTDSALEEIELELLWSRAISPFFDFQLGLRHDFEPDGLTYAVVGLQGLAPYWFEVDAAAYLSEDGDVTAGIEAEYEWLFTQRVILQWRGELLAALSDVAGRQLGAGLASLDLGLRLRYEFSPKFAPYAGIEYSRALGQTANLLEAAGTDNDDVSVLLGVRFWF